MASRRGERRLAALAAAAFALASCATPDAAVPSKEVPSDTVPTDQPPSRAVVRCTAEGVEVDAEAVTTRRRGVRLRFHHEGDDWSIAWQRPDGSGAGDNVDADGVTDVTWPLPPGSATISCLPHDGDSDHDVWDAELTVVDSGGHWRDDALTCAYQVDYELSGRTVLRRDLEGAVAEELAGEVDGDPMITGYRGAREPVVVIQQDGRAVARVTTLATRRPNRVSIDSATRCTRA